jgi:hypothetical protein
MGKIMESTDGESCWSDGPSCPPLQKLQGSGNENAGSGGELQVIQATPTELAAIIQCLKARAESAPAGARMGRASALARTGLRFVAVVLLAAGVGVGLGDGDLFDDVGPSVAQQPSRHAHGSAARLAGEQLGGTATGPGGGAGSGSDDGLIAGQSKREARAKTCVYRLPDGWCEATNQPCRLLTEDQREPVAAPLAIEPHGRCKPVAAEKNADPNIIFHTIGNFHYLTGFEDVWLNRQHYDLRAHKKARLCLEYLAIQHAVNEASARHFLEEIDPYVREVGGLGARGKFSEVKIQDYFREPTGQLVKLCQALIQAVDGTGKYYLATNAG